MKNKIIKLLVGIPASGKSTWKRDFLNKCSIDGGKWVAISRDDYRFMLADSPTLDFMGEQMVTQLVRDAVKTAINNKYNVLIDETNVNLKFLKSSIEYYQTLGDVEFQHFDISIEKAIERDKNRERKVGKDVIEKMYKNYKNLLDSGFDVYTKRKKLPRIETNFTYSDIKDKKNAIIVDLDGTVAHANGKRGYFDWNKVGRDDVDERVAASVRAHAQAGYSVIILTGRDGECEEESKLWLEVNNIPFDEFYCKPNGDSTKDTIFKTRTFKDSIEPNYNVLAVFEDRQRVVDMWRELGVKCYQVIDGSY